MNAELLAWLCAQPGRCAECGYHVKTQKHGPDCTIAKAEFNAKRRTNHNRAARKPRSFIS